MATICSVLPPALSLVVRLRTVTAALPTGRPAGTTMSSRLSPLAASSTVMAEATRLTLTLPCGVRVTVLFEATGSKPEPVI